MGQDRACMPCVLDLKYADCIQNGGNCLGLTATQDGLLDVLYLYTLPFLERKCAGMKDSY